MRVRFIIPAYRDRYGADHVKGDEWDYPDHLAVKFLRLGYAEAVREPKPKTIAEAAAEAVEAAVASEAAAEAVETIAKAPPAENTAKRTGRAKPRKKA